MGTKTGALLKGSKTYYLNCVIAIVLMFVFRLVPPFGQITEAGMAFLSAFIGIIYGWMTVGLLWPSIFGMIAVGTSGILSVSDAMSAGFGSNNTLVVIMAMGLLGVLDSAGVTEWLALKIVGSKVGNGRPWMLVFLIMVATWVLVAFTCSWQVLFVIWSIFYKMVQVNRIEKGPFTEYVVATVVVVSIIAGQVIPYAPQCVVMTSAFTGAGGAEVGFIPYFTWMTVISWIIMGIWVFMGRNCMKIKAPVFDNSNIEKAPPLTTYQKVVLALFVVFLAILVCTSVLPASWGIIAFFSDLGVKGLCFAIIGIICMLNFTEAKGFQTFMKSVDWVIVFVVALINVLASYMTSDELGLLATIQSAATPVIAGLGVIGLLVLLTFLPVVLTNFLNNLVVGSLFMVLAVTFCGTLGISATPLYAAIMLLSCCALGTPAGCATCVVFYGNQEWLPYKTASKYGWLLAAIAWVVVLVVGIPLGFLIL